MQRILLFALLLLCQTAVAQKTQTERLDSLFNALHAAGNFNGNVLIAKNGVTLFEQSYGYADFNSGEKLDTRSVFELASVSKQFTAAAIMLLQRSGKLRYEDELGRWIPELAFYKGVTIRHLLQHTSGVPDYESLTDSLWTDKRSMMTNDSLISFFTRYQFAPQFEPGAKWSYSNTGYALLAAIIEKASGMSYGAYLGKSIFRPLGMQQTTVYRRRYEQGRTLSHYAYGYVRDGSNGYVLPDSLPRTSFVYYLDGIVGDGTVNSTARDLLRWDAALRAGKLLRMEEAYVPAALAGGKTYPYGFGWALGKIAGNHIVNHSGGWPGYNTYISRDLDSGTTVILLKNTEGGGLPVSAINRILYQLPDNPKTGLSLPASLLGTYVGVYELVPEFSITITLERTQLYAQATRQSRLTLLAEKEDLFKVQGVEARIGFVKKDGVVDHLVLYQGGQEQEGRKIK
ncbi:MAG: serine hydrolase [Chitinophagaceae bacterium]|nr:MAG: serine hydrolase [Chitinophagaceae bacterium]